MIAILESDLRMCVVFPRLFMNEWSKIVLKSSYGFILPRIYLIVDNKAEIWRETLGFEG